MSDLEQLKEEQKETMEFLGGLSKHIETNFVVEGKTLAEWKREFFIKLPDPDNITFPIIVATAADIVYKYQKAAYFRDKQNIECGILKQNKIDSFNIAFQNAKLEAEKKFNKSPAAEKCRVEATLAIKHLEDAIATQEVIRGFWVKTCETLVEMRKLVESIGYALGADAVAC